MASPRRKFDSELDELRARIHELEAREGEPAPETQGLLFPADPDDTRLEDLFSKVEDVFGVVNPRTAGLLYISPGVRGLTGITPEQIRTEPMRAFEMVHADDRRTLAEFFAPQTREREIEFRVRRTDGQERWIWLRTWKMFDASGEVEQIVFSGRDVTERRASEDALRKREQRYHALSELNSDFTFGMTIRGGRVVEVDPSAAAFERFTGYSFADVRPAAWPCWIPPSERPRLRRWTREIVDGVHADPIENCIITREGNLRWLQTSMRVHERSDEQIKVLASTSDVTERHVQAESQRRYAVQLEVEVAKRTRELQGMNEAMRALQDRLMRAERLRTAEDIAASIAHSVNNPLAALMGHLQMMSEQADADPMLPRTLELGTRIKVVVERTLALFRKGTLDLGAHRPCDIADEVGRELEVRAANNRVRVHVSASEELPVLVVDRALLVSALVSVAENAIDAMPRGGDLWIDASFVSGLEVGRFRIADTGTGIPEALRRKVLEPFFTTKGGGTGLGLAIAQGVVQGHDGRIEIDRRSGGGTLVTIELPVRPGALETAEAR